MPANIGMRARMRRHPTNASRGRRPRCPAARQAWLAAECSAATWRARGHPAPRASATVRKPAAANISGAPRQSCSRAQGSENTAPMLTLIDRRYSGSAARGDEQCAVPAQPAAFRRIAPTLAWSTMSSKTTSRRSARRSSTVCRMFAMQRGQRAAMNVESRYLLGKILRHDEDRHRRPPLHDIAQTIQPALGKQE